MNLRLRLRLKLLNCELDFKTWRLKRRAQRSFWRASPYALNPYHERGISRGDALAGVAIVCAFLLVGWLEMSV
jgi:hypothetical protein